MLVLILSSLIFIAHLWDVCYTIIAIEKYGLVEASPIWRGISRRPMLFFWASSAFIIVVLTAMQVLNTPAWVYGFALAARIAVLVRNYNVVQRARRAT